MMLGKRTRPPMKRTTSMTEFTLDLNNMVLDQPQPSDPLKASSASPRNHRRNSSDFVETAPFLKSCFLCKRRLIPGRDIYMYRGDSAFCSLECRQQQIRHDERREKYSVTSKNEPVPVSGGADIVASGKCETVATAV